MATTRSDQILVETRNFKDLGQPLTRTSRLRYTSLSVSEKVIAFGSNTGGIYIFSKSDCKLLQVAFADKETAAVSQLLISPNEKFVAFTVSTGKVHVIDLKLETRTKSETLRSVTDLGGAIVTCLTWDTSSGKLYIGDDMGKVSMIPVHTSKAKNLFSIPMEVILKLDSAVVQMDKADDKLLVSTMTRCYLCDTVKQQYTQIGKKPRDGQYGACFLSQGSSTSMIYCARPGSRIWEVDMDGAVLNTHQFKQLLAVSPLPVLDMSRNFTMPDENLMYSGQSVAFPKLKIISGTYLLTWNSSTIYILDPVNVQLKLWNNQFSGITDVCCVRDEVYVFLQSMQVLCLSLMPVSKAIQICMVDAKIETVARMCCFYGNILHRKHLRKHLAISDLYNIYNALLVNEFHELGTNVLSCIKDIESKVAIETDSENSSSNRSRSSSIHSAGAENLIQTEETDQSNAQYVKSVDRKGRSDKDSVLKTNVHDQDLEIDGTELDSFDTSLHLTSISRLHNELVDELDSADSLPDNLTDNCDSSLVNTVTEDHKNPSHNADNESVKFKPDLKDNYVSEEHKNKTDPFTDSVRNVTEDVHVKPMWNEEDGERGEPDGNSYHDEYNEVVPLQDGVGGLNGTSNQSQRLDGTSNQNQVLDKTCNLLGSKSDRNMLCESSKYGFLGATEVTEIDLEKEKFAQDIPFTNRNNLIESTNNTDEVNELQSSDFSNLTMDGEVRKSDNPSTGMIKDPNNDDNDVNNDIQDEEDVFIVENRKSFGPRRSSLTSLSSYSSAEVTLEQPISMITETGDQIAIQVKRRTSRKKKKRKSTSDIIGENMSSPSSIGSVKSLLEEGNIPKIEVNGELESVSQSSEGKVEDKTAGSFKEIIEEEKLETIETPMDDFNGSGEFQQSSDYGVSGEFSASESNFLQSMEKSKEEISVSPTSAPKAAFLKFKDKMQSEVKTKTKKLIKNIKDKNLLTKAKELAETLSQGSDVAMFSPGGFFETDQFESFDNQTGIQNSNTEVKHNPDGIIEDEFKSDPSQVDISELREATLKVKVCFEDATVKDLQSIYNLLRDWVSVLNQTFHRFHIKKYAPLVKNNETINYSENTYQNSVELEMSSQVEQSSERFERTKLEKITSIDDDAQDLEMASNNFEKILSDPDFCYIEDPLNLPLELFKCVSELVQACYEIGCLGDILTYQKLWLKTEVFSSKDQITDGTEEINRQTTTKGDSAQNRRNCDTEINANTISQDVKEENINTGERNFVTKELHESSLRTSIEESETSIHDEVQNSEDREEDGLNEVTGTTTCAPINCFIRLYYPYLQLDKLKKENLQYPEWSALVTCLQGCAIVDGERLGVNNESIISHLLESRHQKNGSFALLGHISRLVLSEGPNAVDAAVKCYPHIQPLDVLNLCHFHKVSIATVFKQYMFKVRDHLHTIHKPDLEEHLFSHPEVRHKWLEILLEEDCDLDKMKDSNGNPRPMSHKFRTKNGYLIGQVMSKLSSYQSTNVDPLLSLFYKYGYWNGVLQLLKYLKEDEGHLKIILHLGDLDLLSHHHPLGYLPNDQQEWEYLLTTFKEIDSAGNQELELNTSDWPLTVTWNSLAILLVRNMGPDLALSLLQKCGLEEGELTAEFYQTCLLSSVVQKQKRLILHSMLEKVDMYLWSQRPAVITPQVHYLLINEDRLKSETESESGRSTEETVSSLTVALKGDKSLQKSPLVEDPECHWGVKTKFNKYCGCCSIPLKEAVSHSEPGVLLFRCGHGFHKQCLPDRECILCDEESDQ